MYWRETTAPQWQHWRWAGEGRSCTIDVPAGDDCRELTLEGLVIDNFLFGVAAVGRDGNESTVVFPGPAPSLQRARRR